MPKKLRKISSALIIGAVVVTSLTGCGRKGDPQAPTAFDTTNKTGQATGEKTNEVDDTPFVLDPLL